MSIGSEYGDEAPLVCIAPPLGLGRVGKPKSSVGGVRGIRGVRGVRVNVSFASGRLQVRLDDHELEALEGGQVLRARVEWPGGGWLLILDPQVAGPSGEGGKLRIGVRDVLELLTAPERAGVLLPGPPRISLEKAAWRVRR